MSQAVAAHPTAIKVHRFTVRHFNKLLALFMLNVCLAFCWGPVLIALTALGPTRHLSSTVIWVAIISYYANMMGNISTAAGLYAAMSSHAARAALEQDERERHRK